MNHHTAFHRGHGMNDCIERCTSCHQVCCLETIRHCLSQGGEHAAPDHVALLATCADSCQGMAA